MIVTCRTAAASLIATLCVLFGASAGADLIYDNGVPASEVGWLSDVGFNYMAMDDFTLAEGGTTITGIHWWGYEAFPLEDAHLPHELGFRVAILDSSFDFLQAPFTAQASVPAQFTGSTINEIMGELGLFSYDYELPTPLLLSPGETYYLMVASMYDGGEPRVWLWTTSDIEGSHMLLQAPSLPQQGDLAFFLTGPGVVPEPTTIALLGVGLGGLALRLLRHRHQPSA